MRWSKTFCFLLKKKKKKKKKKRADEVLESQKNCHGNQISFVLCWGDFNELFSWLGVLIFTISSFVFSFYRKMNTGAPTSRDLDLSKPLYLFFAINNQGFGRGKFKTNIAPLAMHCLSDIRPELARGLINFWYQTSNVMNVSSQDTVAVRMKFTDHDRYRVWKEVSRTRTGHHTHFG